MGRGIHRAEERESSVAAQEAAGGAGLAPGELLGHEEQEFAVLVVNLAQEAPEARQRARILARTAPHDVVGGAAPRQLRQHRRFLAIVEQLVERHLKGARDFLDRVQRGHRVPVLDARDIAPQQAGALFDIPL